MSYSEDYRKRTIEYRREGHTLEETHRRMKEGRYVMFNVIIAGGRDFSDYALLANTMDHLLSNIRDDITVVCGRARGADTLGEQYAKERGFSVQYFPADWQRYGKSAGYLRNTKMAKNADALVAFWDGKSRGTRHMIETAKTYGLKVRVKRYGSAVVTEP